jgi:hypothetical protein
MNPSHLSSDEQMFGAAQQFCTGGWSTKPNERGQPALSRQPALSGVILRETIMAEQPINLSTVLYFGVFSRAEQRVLQAIFKAIAEGGGRCIATLETLARDSNTSKSTTRNAIAQAVAIGLLKKTERRSYCAVSLPNILTYGEAMMVAHTKATHDLRLLEVA